MASGNYRLPIAILLLLITVLLTGMATYALTVRYLLPSPEERLWDWAVAHGHAALNNDHSLKQALMMVPGRLVAPSPSIPELVLDIKFKQMQKLYDKRAEALEKGVLIQDEDDFVPASIRLDGRTVRVKLRLKGDHTDHLEGIKWSFRIQVKGKDHIFGMRRFSLQHPKTRGYQGEALFYDTLRYLGVLAPRYFLVNLTINGNNAGVMALEEHFSKELLEANGRRDSPIIRFDESLYWDEIATNTVQGEAAFDDYRNTFIDTFTSSRVFKSERLSAEAAAATGLLRGFVEEVLEPSEVFDSHQMGRFLAAAQLWGSWHSVRWHNLRFALNPITMKLEPIGFDSDIQGRKKPGVIIGQDNAMMSALLDDPQIYAAYREGLQQLATAVNDGSLIERLKKVEEDFLAGLQKEFFLLQPFPYEEFEKRVKRLLGASEAEHKAYGFSTGNKHYPALIHAYLVNDGLTPYLEVANAIPSEIEILSAQWVPKGNSPMIEFQSLSGLVFPLRLPERHPYSLPEFKRIQYQPPADAVSYTLQILTRIPGQQETHSVSAKPYYAVYNKQPVPESTPDEQLACHPFLTLDREKARFSVLPGRWKVSGSIIIPRGFSLDVAAGSSLQFEPHGALISHGPLNIEGSENEEIILEGDDEGDGTWQGIAVLNADDVSQFSHVIVRNTTGIHRPGWQLTGGVTFYKSDVEMHNSRFEKHRGEDALNLVHSQFELTDVDILETASDALDADYSNGLIQGGVFQSVGKAGGGDAVDISGSHVTINGARFRNISDKALSVGEASKMEAENLFIETVGTGAASKDGSILEITDTSIKGMQQAALMAYIKKPEFGGARIVANNLDISGEVAAARAQTGSTIIMDGRVVDTEDVEVERLYETVMKPGLRK